MRRLMVVTLLLLVIAQITGCSAYVNLGKDKQGMVEFDRVGGYASPERGLRILDEQTYVQERQKQSNVKKALYTQLEKTIVAMDSTTTDSSRVMVLAKINQIQKLIQTTNNEFSGAETIKNRYLGIINSDSDYAIQIQNGPFAGKYLNPGEKTHIKKPFPTGVFPLKYKWYKVGTNSTGTNVMNVSIGEYRSNDIVFD